METKYEVMTITAPATDRDLTVRVNTEVRRVRAWEIKPRDVRVVSLSKAVQPMGHALEQYVLTIEYVGNE